MLKPSLLSISLLTFAACHLSHSSITVDGVRLKEHHEEVLTLEEWPSQGLTIEAHQGDVRVEFVDGPTVLRVVVHEREPGAAHAHIEGGRLRASAKEHGACAIGKVTLSTRGPVRNLTLGTGLGDVELRGVTIEGELKLTTGLGDVELHAAGKAEGVELSSGMGDIEIKHLVCKRLEAETGMGDLAVEGLEAESAKLSSGMGDVDVGHSKGGRLEATSGLGDVDIVESSFTSRSLDTGLGSVRER